MTKQAIITIIVVLILIGGFIYFWNKEDTALPVPTPTPTTPTPEPTPVPSITYNNATANDIMVDLPFPGAVVGKDFSIIGKARGNWYFEASFPFEVLDKDGKRLAQSFATAQGEWMTTNFVPFKGDIKIPSTYIGPGTLVIRNDNASGLPQFDKSISFPIVIEY